MLEKYIGIIPPGFPGGMIHSNQYHWQHCRHFGMFLSLLIFSQNLRTPNGALKLVLKTCIRN